MFTGLVQELGSVAEVASREGATRIRVEAALAADLSEGDSVAVNGVCLTAVEPGPTGFEADLSAETVERTLARLASARASRSTWSCRCARPTGSAATSCRATSTASGE